jgi:predicted lipid-binding transport protein (Tim44 family)
MTRTLVLTVVAVVLMTLAAIGDADAKRLGGGRSLGAQRQTIAPPTSSSGPAANPVMPAQPGVAGATAANPTAANPAAGGGSRWLGPIAGIAAGLGLAALLSHLGLPEGFGTVLLLGLLAIGGVLVFRMLTARRAPSAAIPYARAAAGYGPATAPARVEPVLLPAQPSTPFAGTLPANFDAIGFVREAKLQFRHLQAAWDAGDREALADVMTAAMVAEILRDLDERGPHQTTEIVALDAEMLDVTTDAAEHRASVRFTGAVREDVGPPTPLDEIWNLSKPVDGSTGWLLAGIRQTA